MKRCDLCDGDVSDLAIGHSVIAANIYHLIRPSARRLPYSLTLIMADASGKNKQAEATLSKRPIEIPNSAVEEFKKIMLGDAGKGASGSESQDPVLWEQMRKWWAEPQRGQFLVT